MPAKPQHRRKLLFLSLVGAVVLALLAGVAIWLTSATAPRQNRAPFDEALQNLEFEPAVRYHSALGGGAMQSDVTVTSFGEAVGTATLAGQKFDYLVVDGKTFVRAPDGMLPGKPDSSPVSALRGKWITGGVIGSGLSGVSATPFTPLRLATQLKAAVAGAKSFPKAGDPGTLVGGVPALKASTPAGDLYVTKNAPYRVLRLTAGRSPPGALPSLPSLPALGSQASVDTRAR
ncbi:hypothetical protein, partial [Streptomyces sp. NPDC059564]|uniref:hypothetical protein n=1 Tax=Streptomyces sp. NPDC059564 TaxID=3346865 RepID=UPI0036C5D3EF